MTKQEAVDRLNTMADTLIQVETHENDQIKMNIEAMLIGAESIAASIPHVITLEKARKLEPHTPIWLEFDDDDDYDCEMMLEAGRLGAGAGERIWVGGWPSPELRASTPWEAVAVGKQSH